MAATRSLANASGYDGRPDGTSGATSIPALPVDIGSDRELDSLGKSERIEKKRRAGKLSSFISPAFSVLD
jgi:hypothetical protein